jgi:hypothetical protein
MAKKAYVWDGSAWVEITSQPSVATATTGNAGIVQLVDSTSSVSTTDAATPNSVKTAYDRGSLGVTNAATAQAAAVTAQSTADGKAAVATTAPEATAATAAVGTGTTAARADHVHVIATASSATPAAIAAAAVVGASTVPSREDHVHKGVTSITGTANQVVASAADGAVTLSLPQSIATTSTPTFGATTINGILTGNKSGHTSLNQGILLSRGSLTVTTTTMPAAPTTANTQVIPWTSATKANTSMWSTGNSVTLPLAGMYQFVFGSRFGSGTAYSLGVYAFQGSTLIHHVRETASSTSALDTIQMTGYISAAAADTLTLYIAASASAKTLSANTFLGVMYLGNF